MMEQSSHLRVLLSEATVCIFCPPAPHLWQPDGSWDPIISGLCRRQACLLLPSDHLNPSPLLIQRINLSGIHGAVCVTLHTGSETNDDVFTTCH